MAANSVNPAIRIMQVSKFSGISSMSSLFSLQIANVNAGPVLALESMGAKQYFRCHSLNIALKYKQYARTKFV